MPNAGDLVIDADVIVLGAGAAGLAAARSLAARSLRVMLLEARDRTGGRVWSGTSPRATVLSELGAEFIHGPARETRALLRAGGIATVDTGWESWTRNGDGDVRRDADDDDFISAAGIFEGARKLAEDETVERYLQRFAGDESKRQIIDDARRFVEGFDAADPAIASAHGIADEWASGVDSMSARPVGGYRPMFEWLAGACAAAGVQTHLTTVVKRIAWQHGLVAVDVSGAAGERTVRARAAIVTLPVGVLRHRGATEVAFDPALPAAKRQALEKIEMGHVVKVALWFRTPFWERVRDGIYRDAAFFRTGGQPFTAYWTQVPIRSTMVAAWAGGPKASALDDLSLQERVTLALDGFGRLFGELDLARAEFDRADIHDWTRDPFARGAYSYLAVGGAEARTALATSVDDTLFFAGEATSNDGQGGTVNGALETGERAAREAALALGAEGDK